MINKIYIYAIVAALLLGAGIYLPEHYRNQGRAEITAKWVAESTRAMKERNDEIARLKLDQDAANERIKAQYESQLTIINDKYATAKRDGLRILASTCKGSAAIAEAESAIRDHETESIRLPERIEIGLFDLARRADEVNAQLSSCQKWIKEQGFYETWQEFP